MSPRSDPWVDGPAEIRYPCGHRFEVEHSAPERSSEGCPICSAPILLDEEWPLDDDEEYE